MKALKINEKSSKIRKITEKILTKFQSTISNAPKRGQNMKNTKKSKRYMSNAPKAAYLPKNTVMETLEHQSKSWTSAKNREK